MNNEKNNPFTISEPNNVFKEPSKQETTENTKQSKLRWLALTDDFLKEIQEDQK